MSFYMTLPFQINGFDFKNILFTKLTLVYIYMYLAASIMDSFCGFLMDHSCSLNSMKFAISEKNYSLSNDILQWR